MTYGTRRAASTQGPQASKDTPWSSSAAPAAVLARPNATCRLLSWACVIEEATPWTGRPLEHGRWDTPTRWSGEQREDDPMDEELLTGQVARALEGLRAVLASVESGDLEASSTMRAGLLGGVAALESVHDTDV